MKILFIIVIIDKVLSSNVKMLKYAQISSSLHVKVLLGTPLMIKFFEVNLESNATYICNTISNSSTFVSYGNKTTTLLGETELLYEHCTDTVTLLDMRTTISNLTYFKLYKLVGSYDALAFGSKIIQKDTSLVYSLYNQKQIDKLSFGINNTIYNDGYVYLGGFPDELIDTTHKAKFENVLYEESKWGVKIDNIEVKGKLYDSKEEKAILSSCALVTYAPRRFIDFFNETVMKKYVDKKDCAYEDLEGNEHFLCVCDVFDEIPELKMIIEGKVITFKRDFMYRMTLHFCRLTIEENHKGNYWILGTNFLKNYPIEFSYEDNSIIFYSTNPFDQYERTNYSSVKIILFVNISIMLICMLLYNII